MESRTVGGVSPPPGVSDSRMKLGWLFETNIHLVCRLVMGTGSVLQHTFGLILSTCGRRRDGFENSMVSTFGLARSTSASTRTVPANSAGRTSRTGNPAEKNVSLSVTDRTNLISRRVIGKRSKWTRERLMGARRWLKKGVFLGNDKSFW